jgi:hypothetical protein
MFLAVVQQASIRAGSDRTRGTGGSAKRGRLLDLTVANDCCFGRVGGVHLYPVCKCTELVWRTYCIREYAVVAAVRAVKRLEFKAEEQEVGGNVDGTSGGLRMALQSVYIIYPANPEMVWPFLFDG